MAFSILTALSTPGKVSPGENRGYFIDTVQAGGPVTEVLRLPFRNNRHFFLPDFPPSVYRTLR
jgi:hypothetical protein